MVKPFVDVDGDLHPEGERWRFIQSMFSPNDDDLSIAVHIDDAEWRIILHWTKEAQEEVIENFSEFIKQEQH